MAAYHAGMSKLLRLLVVFVLVFAGVGCKAPKKNPNVLEGGEIKYSVSGNERGIVNYGVGVRPQDAAAVGEWLKDKGWFLTREENRSLLSGKGRPTWGTGAAGRGRGSTPLAKVARRGEGLEVIVYADAPDAESSDVVAFGAESADALKKKVSKPVRFVVRSETKKGGGLEWVDTHWDSDERG